MVVIDLTLELFCVLFFVLSVISFFVYTKNEWNIRYWIIPMFTFYSLMLLEYTIFPIYIYNNEFLNMIKEVTRENMVWYQIIPFASIRNYFTPQTCIQLIGNLLLLSPFAFFVDICTRGKCSVKRSVCFISFVSVGIEVVQLIIDLLTKIPNRIFDIDDLILNILGVIITFFILRIVETRIMQNTKKYHFVRTLFYK